MKNSNSLNILHSINILVSVGLIILSIFSFFYLNKDIITYHENLKDIVFLFRILISTLTLVGAVALIIGGVFPDEPYFLDEKQQKGVKRFAIVNLILNMFSSTSTAATLTAYDSAVNTKFIRRNWNWVASLLVFVFIFFLSYFLFGISIVDDSIEYNLVELFTNSFASSMYNKLIVIILICFLLLTVFSMSWRIIADKIRKDDKYWRRQPIYTNIISLIIIILLVGVSMYFKLSIVGIFILVIVVFTIGKLIENKVDPVTGKDNRQRIFSNTPFEDGANDNKSMDSQRLTFEERKGSINKMQYFYQFGNPDMTKELNDYEKFSEELNCFKNAQQDKDFNKIQPVVNVWIKDNNINGIIMISAFYDLKKALFSKKIKTDEFFVAVHKIEENNHKVEYYWSTKDFEEFKSIFYEFIVNQRTPNLNIFSKNVFD